MIFDTHHIFQTKRSRSRTYYHKCLVSFLLFSHWIRYWEMHGMWSKSFRLHLSSRILEFQNYWMICGEIHFAFDRFTSDFPTLVPLDIVLLDNFASLLKVDEGVGRATLGKKLWVTWVGGWNMISRGRVKCDFLESETQISSGLIFVTIQVRGEKFRYVKKFQISLCEEI